jgi:hypothetical protein
MVSRFATERIRRGKITISYIILYLTLDEWFLFFFNLLLFIPSWTVKITTRWVGQRAMGQYYVKEYSDLFSFLFFVFFFFFSVFFF